MRLESAHIKNFKLLDNVTLKFSNDHKHPLTVIRAENGSGKTSILHALRWAIYGSSGVPGDKRLTDATRPPGRPIIVQVRVEFSMIDPYSEEEIFYRLVRTCEETPAQDDKFIRKPEQLHLWRRTMAGEEEIREGKDSLIRKLLPMNLIDVFFTNGDDVQRFISSGQVNRERQEKVHNAIRQLLGLDDVENVSKDLESISKSLRKELASDGGQELQEATTEVERIHEDILELGTKLNQIQERVTNIDEAIRQDERELDSIKGIGDLDTINQRIRDLEGDIRHLNEHEKNIRLQMKDALKSERLSWQLLGQVLQKGFNILDKLADRRVIPGTAIEVLNDRLELGTCICGEELIEGTDRFLHIKHLIEEHHNTRPDIQHLSKILYLARNSFSEHQSAIEAEQTFYDMAINLSSQYTACRKAQRDKQREVSSERQKRSQIDQEHVQVLAARIDRSRKKRSDFDRQYGDLVGQLRGSEGELKMAREREQQAEKKANLDETKRNHSRISNDLLELAQRTLGLLKSDYVQKVSDRMNDLFLEIVGTSPEAETAVFTRVTINDRYDIVIYTKGDKTLDADYELNGASQRALTLSFIWALMEVASREAPRIIDTPLGMTSGAVKRRMVEILTDPTRARGLPYQVILLMTRSEIRDIEDILDERAGHVFTLSCSKDYPLDLQQDWSGGIPMVRTCECDHRQICPICARRNDDLNQFNYRGASVI